MTADAQAVRAVRTRRDRPPPRLFALLGSAVVAGLILTGTACGAGMTTAGEAIYRDGVLPSGEPLVGRRGPALRITGAEAACVNCHRRSGLGEIEGSIKIPPIDMPYLFHPKASNRDDLRVPYVEAMHTTRDAYTPETLRRAIREGLNPDGAPLSYLMPRYTLGDDDLAALLDYLKAMTPFKAPGVAGSTVNFATIVTPDADRVQRQAMLDVLQQFFADQNAFALAQSPSAVLAPSMKSNGKRRWQLHVWELSGAPATWGEQLRQHWQQQPVYAVIAGLAGAEWRPVHEFCASVALPCLFPNTALPVVADRDFYSLYYSRGVLLEADLVAHQLNSGEPPGAPSRVVQIFRLGDIGATAAAALHAALATAGITTVERGLDAGARAGSGAVAAAVRDLERRDAVVLWLRPPDIAALAAAPPPVAQVYMSGLMSGLDEAPLPAAWRSATRMAYPVDLPDRRRIRVDYAMGWMSLHHIPVVAKQVQADTYVACSLLLETLMHMHGSFTPDYLVERLEGMMGHQLVSGYYPRLEMAPNQRFASKGGYIVRFMGPSGNDVSPVTDWLIP